jgi:glycosyltransferase involved in cell wall biosynthesis
MSKRTLIDLTDLEAWSGTHGGIQRLVYSIAQYFFLEPKSSDSEVLFISVDSERKQFYHTTFAPIYQRVEAARNPGRAPELEELAAVESTVRLDGSLKARLRRAVPQPVRRNQLVRKVAAKSLTMARELKRLTSDESAPSVAGSRGDDREWLDFTSQDTVLLMGMPWGNPDIMETLIMERRSTKMRLVQVVYDMIIPIYPHLHHPDNFEPYTDHMLKVIEYSDLLLPISKSTDKDLHLFARRHKLKVPDTKVIRLGDEVTNERKAKATKPDARIKTRFIACVGTIEVRKNHTLLYYAYKLAEERGIEMPQLLIVGGQGWYTGDIQYLFNTDPALKDKVLLLHGLSDAALDWIYRNCMFTVYPSMYEGWGLPVAESLGYGKLCVTSHASSIPEIAGDLNDYFSPYDTEECMKKIQLYTDGDRLARKERRIRSEYRQTSWKQTYKQVSDLIQ